MLDSDLAILYGYEVKRLNEQVKNNINRFPEDFMFQMTKEEVKDLRSKFSTANINPKSRSLPHVFSEQGIYMLATVLNGEIAEKQSIFIMRAFREMRHFIMNNERMFERINSIELKQFLTQFIEKVEIYEEEQENGQWLKSIEFKLPIISKDMKISLDNGSQIECVIMMQYCGKEKK